MQILLNGEKRTVESGTTVRDVVEMLDIEPTRGGVAVAVNRQVVSRGDWSDQPLEDGDRIEVLNAVQGG